MRLFLLCTISLLMVMGSIQAQQADTLSQVEKQVTKEKVKRHSPKKAAIRSALLPGLGQIYNKKYWKLPIIYAGFGGLGYAIGFNTKRWRTYSDAYRARVDGDSTTVDGFVNEYSADNLLTLKKLYKRNMDLSIIFTVVLYALNIVDATVDAHLFEYDISDDLTMRVDPIFEYRREYHNFAGIKLSFKL